MNYDTLLTIFGLPLDDSLTKSVIGALSETPEEDISKWGGYISFMQSGISILIELKCPSCHRPCHRHRVDLRRHPQKVVSAIFLSAAGWEGFGQFAGTLPFGLQFGASIADGLKQAGTPLRIQTQPVDPSILKEYPFEKRTIHSYRIADLSCHLTYGKENTLVQVQLHFPFEE